MSGRRDASLARFVSCGVRVDAMALDDAAQLVASGRAAGAVHLCNAYTLSLAAGDRSYAAILDRGRLKLADGMPLVWIARCLGFGHMTHRVSGLDLFHATFAAGVDGGVRHFLFGSTPSVVASLEAELQRRHPEATIVGAHAPPFGEFDDVALDAATERFVCAGADVVWVGLGTPKQDVVVAALAERSDLTFVAVGAAFDFIGGSKPIAPSFVGALGFEWLFRLVSEPRRLWRRYLVGNVVFIAANIRRRPRRAEGSFG